MIDKTDITIVIPHWSNKETDYALDQCLMSLAESQFPMNHVIVAHNGDIHRIGLEFEFSDIREIYLDEQGQCKAVNAAAGMVSTPWIMVSNNDMVYPPDWFERLTQSIGMWLIDNNKLVTEAELELKPNGFVSVEDPSSAHLLLGNVYSISPQLIEPTDGAPTFKKVFFGGVGGDWNKEGFMEYAQTHEGEGLRSGFNLPFLIKKEVWDMVGGYDVYYDPYGSNSDSDLEYKLKLAGVQMWQQKNCPIYHFSQTSGTFHPSKQEYWQKNWDYFFNKWGFPRTDDGIWEATFTIPMDKLSFHPIWEGIYSSSTCL